MDDRPDDNCELHTDRMPQVRNLARVLQVTASCVRSIFPKGSLIGCEAMGRLKSLDHECATKGSSRRASTLSEIVSQGEGLSGRGEQFDRARAR